MNSLWISCMRKKSLNLKDLFAQQRIPIICKSFKYFSEGKIMKILNVAEKNDAAKNISALLSSNGTRKREGTSKFNKIYEFECEAFNQNCIMIMTSVSGHVLNFDFESSYSNWSKVDPIELFSAPIQKTCSSKNEPIKQNLINLIKSCNTLIIWTDCDREGENIGFEIIEICKKVQPNLKIFRAKFSEITSQSVKRALNNLEMPNKYLSDAVEVRQELDLRIGAAFTRFQTLFFDKVFKKNLDVKMISYGSCQFPTLGFVVERFKNIAEFVSEPFWEINVEHTVNNFMVNFEWKRNKLFDKTACEVLFNKCFENGTAEVIKVDNKPKTKFRPKPLNTIDFEKIASKILKINAKEALQIAESLYTEGLISYPRTETTIFPQELNLKPLVEAQTVDPNWGEFARQVLNDGPTPFQGKKSDQAHPPIHPIKYCDTLQGKKKKIYELIVRHFLACLSKHAEGSETTVEIVVEEERFVAKGLIVTARNYLDVYPYEKWNNKKMLTYREGDIFKPDISMKEGTTSPPELLTESDLLSLMEKHGIGTDATQAEHIETIKARLYVGLKNDKYFVPRTLGMALVEGYNKIGYEIAKPKFRAALEADLMRICQNQISTEEVLSHHIKTYKEIYEGVQSKLDSFLNTLTMYLEVEGKGVKFLKQKDFKNLMKCKSCDSLMILKRNDNSHFLECSKHPVCQENLIFPSYVTDVTPTSTVCSKCGPDNHLLKFTFRSENNIPHEYIGCVGGCNENLLEILNGLNTEQYNPTILSNFNNKNDNDSEFCSASKNLLQKVLPNLGALKCNCGLPAIRLQVKKQGPNNNRYFYKCAKQEKFNPCNFFEWENENCFSKKVNNNRHETTVSENHSEIEEVRCYCAFPCKRNIVKKLGANKGRGFYSCGKPLENSDRCNFFKWIEDKNLVFNQLNSVKRKKK